MKFSEKLRKYRKVFDLSQEQLGEKINVSRQVITKWESENGMPEISNLKALADLFNVTIDYLLDDEKTVEHPSLKEKYVIEGKKNNYSNRYDYAVNLLKERYPEPNEIYGLSQSRKMSKLEWVADLLIQPGVVDMIHYLNDFAIWFMVETETKKLLIKVSNEYIETRELSSLINSDKFTYEKNKFVKLKKI